MILVVARVTSGVVGDPFLNREKESAANEHFLRNSIFSMQGLSLARMATDEVKLVATTGNI